MGAVSSDAAAEAFDALRSEVALLRRAIEGLSAQQPERPPNYSPSLAKIEKATVALGERVEQLAANPMLTLTPDAVATHLRTHATAARQEVQHELSGVMTAFSNATGVLTQSAGVIRTREAQRRWVAYAVLAGGVAAVIGWLGLSGPAARTLPASWQVPERIAAATLGQDRWAAGTRLMRGADEAAWRRLVQGQGIVVQNRRVLEACWKRAERLRQPVACEIRIGG